MIENNDEFLKSIAQLEESVSSLEKKVKKQISFRRNFILAMVRGFGSVVGATVVFGLILAAIIQIVRGIDYVPIINNMLNSQAIENVINKFTQI
jgi:hypothetical protein